MIRLIIDKYGDAHNNLFLKIDGMPSVVKIADSYFLYDFLEISDKEIEKLNLKEGEIIKYAALELIKYWKEKIKSIQRGDKKFIPFDLSDEYIGGLLLEKIKLGFKIKTVFTDEIQGYSISKSYLDNLLDEHNVKLIEDSNEWLIGEDTLYKGLEWSEQEIIK